MCMTYPLIVHNSHLKGKCQRPPIRRTLTLKKEDFRRTPVFGLFDPLRVNISALPPLCFMIYYIIGFICHQKTLKIQKKYHSPLLGLAPSDPRYWTPFVFFDPIRVKISTLPPLCFMFYHTMRFVCRQQKLKIQKQIVSPFWEWALGFFSSLII